MKLIFSVKKLGGIAGEGVSPIVQMELAITTIVVQRASLGHQQLGRELKFQSGQDCWDQISS